MIKLRRISTLVLFRQFERRSSIMAIIMVMPEKDSISTEGDSVRRFIPIRSQQQESNHDCNGFPFFHMRSLTAGNTKEYLYGTPGQKTSLNRTTMFFAQCYTVWVHYIF
ncbi:hypothetical protein PchlR47_09735 [Pseudomonas chlororaphis]|nr:hypothetical protein DK261_11870 [Pseudomonas sp. RW409]QHC88588.1 hypothetical protein PchlR47_09735 [Pseudomonas chlororaphis]